MRAVLLIFALLSSGIAHSEEFLGVEQAEPAKKSNKPAEVIEVPKEDKVATASETSSGAASGRWSGSAALWPGMDQFSAHLAIHYHMNRFVGIDTVGRYGQTITNKHEAQMYGPEVYLALRLANPTILTPIAGAGLGYDRWRRVANDVLFSDGGSATALAYVGAAVNLTKHFGLQVTRRQKTYLDSPPASFADHSVEEERTRTYNEVGFALIF